MRVLLLGASGFIGGEIARALVTAGHSIRAPARALARARRRGPVAEWLACDLRDMNEVEQWLPLVRDCDAVINASGALQSGLRDDVSVVQDRAIRALIDAAAQCDVAVFVQISAAGVGTQSGPFMESKARADAALAESSIDHTILRPGLVIGRTGFGGTELLRTAAGLPFRVDIAGFPAIQCIALSDVVAAVELALQGNRPGTFDLVESESRSLGEIIALHRNWLGLPPPGFEFILPAYALRAISLPADALGWLGWRSPLRSSAIAALRQGVTGDAEQTRAMLGREPRSLPEELCSMGSAGKADRWHARLASLYPLALVSLVVLWLGGAVVGLARLDACAALLVEGGIGESAARNIVIGGALADLAVALGILFRPTLKLALGSGAAIAGAYAIGAVFVRPDLWLDPLGAMIKVLPIIVLSLLCLAMAEER